MCSAHNWPSGLGSQALSKQVCRRVQRLRLTQTVSVVVVVVVVIVVVVVSASVATVPAPLGSKVEGLDFRGPFLIKPNKTINPNQ